MSIVVKEPAQTDFIPAPEGVHVAVCVDVADLGRQELTFSGVTRTKEMIRLSWQLEEKMETGEPYLASCRYTKSLHEKSKLRKHLQAWRGKKFTKKELEGFDLETLIGQCCQLAVEHNEKEDGRVWANVTSVMGLPKGVVGIDATESYVRQKDRAQENGQPEEAEPTISDDEIPF